jgi:hypothetical protein
MSALVSELFAHILPLVLIAIAVLIWPQKFGATIEKKIGSFSPSARISISVLIIFCFSAVIALAWR